MKILGVGGSHLNSLRQFEIRFDEGPLANAGIVAITGPTGAGKSTVLDAVSLALYGTTPRLGTRTGDIITRGASTGSAFVDFAVEGHSYRSTWRRHYAKSGALQAAHMELVDLATQETLATGLNPVRVQVQRIVGLATEEFRRAVLLAQGDFNAFLHADLDERTRLLEHLTGSDLYRRLSQLAFERRAESQQRLDVAQAQLNAVQVLTPIEEEGKRGRLADVGNALSEVEITLTALRAHTVWVAHNEELNAKLADADARLRQLGEQQSAIQTLETELNLARQAAALRPELEQIRDVDARRTQMTNGLETLQLSSSQAEARAKAAADALRVAHTKNLEAAAQRAQATADLDLALSLDTRLIATQQAVETAQHAHLAAVEQVRQTTETHAKAQDAIIRARADLTAASGWQADHADAGRVAAVAPRLRVRLQNLKTAVDAETTRTKQVSVAASRLAKRRAAAQQARALLDAVRGSWHAQTDKSEALRKELEDLLARDTRAHLRSQSERLALQCEGLSKLLTLFDDVADAHGEHAACQRRTAEASRDLAIYQARVRETQAALAEANQAVELQRQVVLGRQAARTLAQLQAGLREGEPCPVCGGVDHDGPMSTQALDQASHQAQATLDDLERAAVALQNDLSDARGDAKSAGARLPDLTRQQATTRVAAERASSRLEQAMHVSHWTGLPYRSAIASQHQTLQARIDTLHRRLEHVDAVQTHLDQLRPLCIEATREVDDAERALLEARQHVDLAEAAFNAASEERATAKKYAMSLGKAIVDELPHPGVTAALRDRGPEAATELIDELESQWAQSTRSAHAAATVMANLESELQHHAADLQRNRDLATQSAEALAHQRHALTALVAERSRIFDGVSVDAHRGALDKAVQVAAANLSETQSADHAAQQALAAITSTLEQTIGRIAELDEEHNDRTEAASAAAATIGWSFEDANQAVRPALWMIEAENRVGAHKSSVTAARARHEAWANELHKHLARTPDNLDPALATKQLQDAVTQERELVGERARLSSDLARHDAAIKHQAKLASNVGELERIAGIRASLAEIIGQRTGERFQRFAQGLTLGQLMVLANRHLATLRPRYLLERVQDADLDFRVVDQHMVDERRAVDTLSGGESFVVSLALALGLSDLARGKTTLDSLFLDEGFGSLDPESLDLVLETLEELNARGRQVFVVSHVDAMKERMSARIDVVPMGNGFSEVRVA